MSAGKRVTRQPLYARVPRRTYKTIETKRTELYEGGGAMGLKLGSGATDDVLWNPEAQCGETGVGASATADADCSPHHHTQMYGEGFHERAKDRGKGV
jgi:hypothetical protein